MTTEAQEQISLIKWWKDVSSNLSLFEHCLFHIPNGGTRTSIIEARRLKQAGVRSGVPDLMLAIPREPFHGLWIELKRTKGGVPSDNQINFIKFLRQQGYAAFICHGALQAEALIHHYLSAPESLSLIEDLNYDMEKYNVCK